MNLSRKKALAAKALKVGKKRIALNIHRIPDIKEAITKQDMKDLYNDNAISIKEKAGRKKVIKRRTRRRDGSIKKRVNKTKQKYVKLTRKLRAYILELKKQNKITPEEYKELRKEIRAGYYRSKNNLREHLFGGKQWEEHLEEEDEKQKQIIKLD